MNQKQAALIKRVYETGLAVDDIVLYLDTHPTCEKGIKYYHEAVKDYEIAKKEYEEACGPLFKTNSVCHDYFDWINNPWPFEGGCD